MAVIQRLSQHVADLIAAGEVVERPASCVKELVENAIDAGAKTVTVELQNGGMTLLRVTDDGCGMEADDARTAFLRHATSKLHTKEDLTAIRTLGFRGEALAAISAVSRIDLLTRTAQAQTGTALHLEAGVVTDEQPAGCPVGTTILVRDLFYNTPARLKFMKSDLAESSAALTVAQHLALANPGVSLRVVKDGAEALHTAGSGVLFDAVYAVLGRQLAGEMVKVDGKFEKIETSGFATRPACTRGNRQQQLFFVNGRFVKSRLLMSALEQAYQNQMTVGRFPSCVLHIQLPPQAVDVNVHPAKTEVKFLREREVFDAVHYAVLSALGRASGRQELKLPQQKPAQAPAAQAKPQQDFFKTMDAAQYRAQAEKTAKPVFTAREREWTKTVCEAARIPAADVPKAPEAPRAEQTHTVAEPVKHPEQEAPKIAEVPPVEPVQQTLPIADAPWRVIGEALDTYILVQQGEKLLFIDKHAAAGHGAAAARAHPGGAGARGGGVRAGKRGAVHAARLRRGGIWRRDAAAARDPGKHSRRGRRADRTGAGGRAARREFPRRGGAARRAAAHRRVQGGDQGRLPHRPARARVPRPRGADAGRSQILPARQTDLY